MTYKDKLKRLNDLCKEINELLRNKSVWPYCVVMEDSNKDMFVFGIAVPKSNDVIQVTDLVLTTSLGYDNMYWFLKGAIVGLKRNK